MNLTAYLEQIKEISLNGFPLFSAITIDENLEEEVYETLLEYT